MDNMSRCPSDAELQAWQSGGLERTQEDATAHHVAGCEACQREAHAYQKLSTVLSSCRPLPLPEGFADRVVTGVLNSPAWVAREAGALAPPQRLKGHWLLLALMALASAVALALWPQSGGLGGMLGTALLDLLRSVQFFQLLVRVLEGIWQLFEPIRGQLLLLACMATMAMSALGRRIVVQSLNSN